MAEYLLNKEKADSVQLMSKLLALDQSSHITGYAIFENGKLTFYDKFEFDDEDIGVRLEKIRARVQKIISEHNIEEVVMEDIQLQNNVGSNVQTFKILAEVFGVIYELLTELKIPNSAVLASSWKSTLNIRGKNRSEQKRNAQIYIQENYGIKPIQDICDAICIGLHHLTKKNDYDWSE